MLFAILPAAGHSTRMGRPKLSLPLGGRTVIERVIATLRDADVDRVLVVVGPHAAELAALAESAGASVLRLANETPDMRATVDAGLTWAETNWQPTEADAFLLVPADHPALDVEAVKELGAARADDAERDIAIPTFDGRRGHPALIGWRHVTGIRALPAELGLNAYLRQQAAATREVPVASASVLIDLDTPVDYERLLAAGGINRE
jgi:molybdenum cofactor cytidylyltransferase